MRRSWFNFQLQVSVPVYNCGQCCGCQKVSSIVLKAFNVVHTRINDKVFLVFSVAPTKKVSHTAGSWRWCKYLCEDEAEMTDYRIRFTHSMMSNNISKVRSLNRLFNESHLNMSQWVDSELERLRMLLLCNSSTNHVRVHSQSCTDLKLKGSQI